MTTPVRITKQDLAQKVQDGWKKDQLAEHYGLPRTQMTKVLQEAGLRIRKFHKPKYELVDELELPTANIPVADSVNVTTDLFEELSENLQSIEEPPLELDEIEEEMPLEETVETLQEETQDW